VTRYAAGHNIPGWLPDSEPAVFDTWSDAVAAMDAGLADMADGIAQSYDVEPDAMAAVRSYHDARADLAASAPGRWLAILPCAVGCAGDRGLAWWIDGLDGTS